MMADDQITSQNLEKEIKPGAFSKSEGYNNSKDQISSDQLSFEGFLPDESTHRNSTQSLPREQMASFIRRAMRDDNSNRQLARGNRQRKVISTSSAPPFSPEFKQKKQIFNNEQGHSPTLETSSISKNKNNKNDRLFMKSPTSRQPSPEIAPVVTKEQFITTTIPLKEDDQAMSLRHLSSSSSSPSSLPTRRSQDNNIESSFSKNLRQPVTSWVDSSRLELYPYSDHIIDQMNEVLKVDLRSLEPVLNHGKLMFKDKRNKLFSLPVT